MKNVYLKCRYTDKRESIDAMEHVLYRQGIKDFYYDQTSKEIKITYDEKKVSIKQMLAKLREIGYHVEVMNK